MTFRKFTKTFWDFNILAYSGQFSKNIAFSKKIFLRKITNTTAIEEEDFYVTKIVS
jgi:hypothetical protein